MEFTRRVDNSIYSRKALADAREVYGKYCSVRAAPGSDGLVGITVAVKGEYEEEARRVILEFWNYFLDTACQQQLESA
jgi:hypothetical protein